MDITSTAGQSFLLGFAIGMAVATIIWIFLDFFKR